MTSSFGISPQRQLRDYTVQPQKPADLPRPAEPVSEPQRLGGQLMDARSFQQDTQTAQTLKSIEQFLGDQGVFAKESAAYFERYKEEKKQEAFNLYKQESAAYQQSIENAKDVKVLEKNGDSETAKQLRVSNPWANYFYYSLKSEDASNDIGLSLAAWGKDNLDNLANIKDPAAQSAAIAKQAQIEKQRYPDLPSAFVTAKIDPVIASVQSNLKKLTLERSFELKNEEIVSVARDHLRDNLANIARARKVGALMGDAQKELQQGFTQVMAYLTDVHGFQESKATATIAAALNNLFIDVNGDGLNDLGEHLTGDAIAKALATVKTKDGISLSSLVYDDKGNTIGSLVQSQYAKALGEEEKRSTARQANITREAKTWERTWEQRAIQWKLQNPDATPEQINAQIKSEIKAITSDGSQLGLSNKSLPEIQKFVKDIYTPMDELVSPQQMIDDKTYADQLNREGKPFPPAFLNSLRGKPYMAELVTQNAQAVGSAGEALTKNTRTKLLKDLKESLKDRFATSPAMQSIREQGQTEKDRKNRWMNSALVKANQFMDIAGSQAVNDAVYEAKQKGLDLRDPRVVADIFNRVNESLGKRPEFNNPEFYFNLGSDNTKAFGAPSNRVPSVSFSKKTSDGAWEISPKHTDNLLTWSRTAKPVLGNNPATARTFLKNEFLFSENELQQLSAALHTGKFNALPTSIRQKLDNFRFATNGRIPLSEVAETQITRYLGSPNDQVKAVIKGNAKKLQSNLSSFDAVPASPRQTDLGVFVNNWTHRHSANAAVDVQIKTLSGQLANNAVPSPVSGDVIYSSASSGQVSGHGNVVIIRASSDGNGYKAGDRILFSHGSKALVTGGRVTVGQSLMLTGGPGTTTGNGDPGVIHIQVFKPGAGAFPTRAEQHPQPYQNNFVRKAVFPLFQRKSYPNY
jgi:hypothetical protein